MRLQQQILIFLHLHLLIRFLLLIFFYICVVCLPLTAFLRTGLNIPNQTVTSFLINKLILGHLSSSFHILSGLWSIIIDVVLRMHPALLKQHHVG